MEFKDVVFGRRSIRKYTDKLISDELIEEIIESAIMAPSGVNLQPWYFVVIKSDEKLMEFKEIMSRVYEKFEPVLLHRFSRNPETIVETEKFLNNLGGAKVCILAFLLKPDYEDATTVTEGVAAAIENLLLAAWNKGIGSCWMTAPLKAGFSDEISKKFAPGNGNFIAAITLGYPAEIPNAPKRREGRYIII